MKKVTDRILQVFPCLQELKEGDDDTFTYTGNIDVDVVEDAINSNKDIEWHHLDNPHLGLEDGLLHIAVIFELPKEEAAGEEGITETFSVTFDTENKTMFVWQ